MVERAPTGAVARTASLRSAATLDNVCVYCGSASGGDPVFADAARAFGAALAAENVGLVYGGGGHGLMGTLARAVLDNGGRVTGIIPEFLKPFSLDKDHEQVLVEDISARKRLMFDRADAFVALPGGMGTLDELVEQLTLLNLRRHEKPLLLADIRGYWRPLIDLIAHARNEGFIPRSDVAFPLVATAVDAVIPTIRAHLERSSNSTR